MKGAGLVLLACACGPSADLAIEIQTANSDLARELVVTNHGPDPATSPLVVLEVGAPEVSFETIAGVRWACEVSAAVGTCFTDHLDVGAVSLLDVTFSTSSTAALFMVAGDFTVSSIETDDDTANNSASLSAQVINSADVEVTIQGPATAALGVPVTYEVTVVNHGPIVARNVAAFIKLPIFNMVVISADGWDCQFEAPIQQVFCRRDDLASGSSTIELSGLTARVGSSQQMVSVSTATVESTDENNFASVTTDVGS